MAFFNVLVIGSGIAGLTAALKAGKEHSVALITKNKKPDSSTNFAQGGIATVIAPDDSFEYHINDTLDAGDGLCKKDRVRILAEAGPATITQLIEWGVRFTRDPAGKITKYHLGLEGGHSHKRILHANDLTGKEIMRALILEAQGNPNITFLEDRFALDLLQNDQGKCIGAKVLNRKNGKVEQYRSNSTILTTGGAGVLFKHTTNPSVATADGIAMAYRAGTTVEDLEFMQFHPTSLYESPEQNPDNHRPFLISEAVRGHGGILKNHDGEEFMDKIHPLRSLAPRDIVARAIDQEMKKSHKAFMYLDITHRSKKDLKLRFPNIFAKCEELGLDISKDWIPVVPAAHYMCGGVLVNENSQTNIEGLYACGEVACTGVHGANRLASNSLLESVVYAVRAWNDIKRSGVLNDAPIKHVPMDEITINCNSTAGIELKEKLQNVMWKKVGIVRSDEGLKDALNHIKEYKKELSKILSTKESTFYHWEVRNMLLASELIVRAALKRKESRGLHCSIDYPNKDENFFKHLPIKSGDVETF